MEYLDRGVYHLSGTRIYPMRASFKISDPNRSVTDAQKFHVIRVKRWIVNRKSFHLKYVFKTNRLESLIPFFYASFNIITPSLRKIVIHVKHDWIHWLYRFAIFIFLNIFRLYIPTSHVMGNLRTIHLSGHVFSFYCHNIHTRIT